MSRRMFAVLAGVVAVVSWGTTTTASPSPVAAPVIAAPSLSADTSAMLVADDIRSLGAVEWGWVDHFEAVGPHQGLVDVQEGYSSDPRRSPFCHQLVHELGRRTYRQLQSLSEAVEVETGWCGGGFTHGVFEEWARHEDAWDPDRDLVALCGSIPPQICGHGIGHALMQDVPELSDAFARCQQLLGDQGWDCVEGVLMLFTQSYLRPHPDDPRFDMGFSIRALCELVPAPFVEECEWTAGATWLGVTGNPDRVRALSQCVTLIRGPLSPLRCAYGLGTVIPDFSGWDVSRGFQVCDAGPEELADWCVYGLVWVLGRLSNEANRPHPCLEAVGADRVRCEDAARRPPLRIRTAAASH